MFSTVSSPGEVQEGLSANLGRVASLGGQVTSIDMEHPPTPPGQLSCQAK